MKSKGARVALILAPILITAVALFVVFLPKYLKKAFTDQIQSGCESCEVDLGHLRISFLSATLTSENLYFKYVDDDST